MSSSPSSSPRPVSPEPPQLNRRSVLRYAKTAATLIAGAVIGKVGEVLWHDGRHDRMERSFQAIDGFDRETEMAVKNAIFISPEGDASFSFSHPSNPSAKFAIIHAERNPHSWGKEDDDRLSAFIEDGGNEAFVRPAVPSFVVALINDSEADRGSEPLSANLIDFATEPTAGSLDIPARVGKLFSKDLHQSDPLDGAESMPLLGMPVLIVPLQFPLPIKSYMKYDMEFRQPVFFQHKEGLQVDSIPYAVFDEKNKKLIGFVGAGGFISMHTIDRQCLSQLLKYAVQD